MKFDNVVKGKLSNGCSCVGAFDWDKVGKFSEYVNFYHNDTESLRFGRPSTKSIEMSIHTHSRSGKGCKKTTGWVFVCLAC